MEEKWSLSLDSLFLVNLHGLN